MELPKNSKELEKLYFEEAGKLISPSLKILEQILEKKPGLVNKYIGDTGLTLLMLSTKIPKIYENIKTLIRICMENGANVSMKSKDGENVLELAINENNLLVIEILLEYSPLRRFINQEKDSLVIYNLLNRNYEKYTEQLSSDEYNGSKEELKKDLERTKKLLKGVFGDLFDIVINSSSEDNYKLLPENLNPNIVNMNVGIEDLHESNNYIKTVCTGDLDWRMQSIKNNAKILEYLLKNGVHAYNENPRHKPLKDSPLALVLFNRVAPNFPSAEMVQLLLDYGAPIYLQYKTITESGQQSDEFLWTIIEKVKKVMELPPSGLSPEELVSYQEEYKKIIALLYQGIALQVILLTPKTIMDGLMSEMLFKEERQKMLSNLIKYHPEAFTGYPKLTQQFEVKEIDDENSAFDIIMHDDIKIADFLEEDRDNHIVMRDYDRPESTFLIDLNYFRNAIDVDYSVLNPGEENEDELFDSEYDPTNPNHVPGPGKKGGRGILFNCNKFLDGSAVTLSSVNNSVPYFNLKAVAGWGGLIPLLEVYDKLLNKQVAERGQFFTYKVLDEKVTPLSGISVIEYIGSRGRNRYGGRVNYVSAAHCQEGQYEYFTTIIPAIKLDKKVELLQSESFNLDPYSLNDGELRSALTAEGVRVGPINDTTRLPLMKKLERILRSKTTREIYSDRQNLTMSSAGGRKLRKTKKKAKHNNSRINKKNIYKKMNYHKKTLRRKKRKKTKNNNKRIF